ncbi:MAG TPA: hypothetical protein VGZ25_07365 [Gemmataceae bacterium]|jgi:hypothetical protein|nr:hypothetical protein [Gemmataceae bacterium]
MTKAELDYELAKLDTQRCRNDLNLAAFNLEAWKRSEKKGFVTGVQMQSHEHDILEKELLLKQAELREKYYAAQE